MEAWPTWLQFLTAVGVGGIFVKILDLIFLQPQTAKREYWNWLRDKRLITYSELIDLLMQGGEDHEKLAADYFAITAKATRASILIDDESLLDDIQLCLMAIPHANYLHEKMIESKWSDKEKKEYYKESARVRKLADRIIKKLRNNLLKPPPTLRYKLGAIGKRLLRRVNRKSVPQPPKS
jgi:hypothetical protein